MSEVARLFATNSSVLKVLKCVYDDFSHTSRLFKSHSDVGRHAWFSVSVSIHLKGVVGEFVVRT